MSSYSTIAEATSLIEDEIVEAGLNARLSNGAPVLAYLPSSSRWEPDERAREIIRCVATAALRAIEYAGWKVVKKEDG